jgi:hypothetical protein
VYHRVRKFESHEFHLDLRSNRARDDRLTRETPQPAPGRGPWLAVGVLVPIVVVAIVYAVGVG